MDWEQWGGGSLGSHDPQGHGHIPVLSSHGIQSHPTVGWVQPDNSHPCTWRFPNPPPELKGIILFLSFCNSSPASVDGNIPQHTLLLPAF